MGAKRLFKYLDADGGLEMLKHHNLQLSRRWLQAFGRQHPGCSDADDSREQDGGEGCNGESGGKPDKPKKQLK